MAVAYLLVVVWGVFQVAWTAPAGWEHPIWQMAPEGAIARIGADPGQGGHFVLRLATYGMVAWISVASTLTSERAWRYVEAIALFSTCLAIFGLYAAFTGIKPILGFEGERSTVVSATFVNHNSYAAYAAFGLVANIVVDMKLAQRGVEDESLVALRNFFENFFSGAWLYAVGVLLCGAGVALSASRAGGGGALIGLVVLLVCLRGRGRGGGPILWVVLVGTIGFVGVALNSDVVDRLLATNEEQLRFVVFPVIFDHIFDPPLLGQGIGAFHDTFRALVPVEAALAEWTMAHKSYLENFYELGIPVSGLLYLVLFLGLVRLFRGLKVRAQDRALPALAVACMASAGFHAMFDFSLQMPAIAALFAAILGLGWSQSFTWKDRASQSSSDAKNDI